MVAWVIEPLSLLSDLDTILGQLSEEPAVDKRRSPVPTPTSHSKGDGSSRARATT